jgi:aspartokinase/homoserine dehydrogenase 1
MDVARKVAILARECGLPLELSTLGVTSLVPPALEGAGSPAEFLQQLHVVGGGPGLLCGA